jgi:hypothetical protein
MVNFQVDSASVVIRSIAMLGALLTASACGGTEEPPPPGSGGAGSGGAGMPLAGAGGSSGSIASAGSGGTAMSGGAGGVGGTAGSISSGGASGTTSSGGAAGTSSATGGAGIGGGAGNGAGGTLGGSSGAGGTSAGMAGMAGSSPSVGGAGSGGMSGSAGSAPEALSFEADIWPVFEKIRDPVFVYYGGSTYESCTTTGVCHGGNDPGAGLSMADASTAYDELLGVPSTSSLCDETVRVVAGQPEQSCLILFYEGRLREELGWVDAAEIDLVRRWIADGARP